ncbi:proline-rich protein 35 [Discoglossus pictus]
MSKEEDGGCKMGSTCKNKERKPKKPHYIPRPWGKPYNYKCFQCPFTCMEKSHLYNHMKYSLCKNSLSLLIESDWPYKKSNFLIPEMHLLQEQQQGGSQDKQEACDSTGASISRARHTGEKCPSELPKFLDEDEDREEEEEEAVDKGRKEKAKGFSSPQASPCKSEANASIMGLKAKRDKLSKEGEPEFIITDVFSLEGQFEKESEEQRHTKTSRKSSSNAGGVRSEQWKLLNNTLKKGGADIPAGCTGANIIPCYPPPTYTEYQEHQGLSLLGINYPLNTNLFSYLSPTMTTSSAQLPFLASTAQLMHPAHTSHFQALQNSERSSFLPRFYYPLLFEHSFSTSEGKVATGKSVSQAQPGPTSFIAAPKSKTPAEALKTCQHKSPEIKSTVSWGSSDKMSKHAQSHHKLIQEEEGKWPPQPVRDINQQQRLIPSGYGTLVPSTSEEAMPQKGTGDGHLWTDVSPAKCLKRKPWLERDGPDVGTDRAALLVGRERASQSSSCSPPMTSPDPWCETSPVLGTTCKRMRGSTTDSTAAEIENTSVLIGDLSRTLDEYGKVERKLANLASGDNSRQKALGEQLGKIRMELLHIHHALEKVSCPHEGPLDLSIKRVEDMDKPVEEKSLPVDDPVLLTPSESSPKHLVKVELLPPELVSCYVRPTKCEADSSVLLCPDGRVAGAGLPQLQVTNLEEGAGIGFGGVGQVEGM